MRLSLLEVKELQPHPKYKEVSKQIEILSVPRRVSGRVKLPSKSSSASAKGLPINSLPGWEFIPLNCKLPMLKCPGNEVIFTKNKIGEKFKIKKIEFDLSTNEPMTEYNALQDPSLRKFYTTPQSLKRLRKNNEITENNDVICTLKDFNAFRSELHKSQVYYMMQALQQHDIDTRNRYWNDNCEDILQMHEESSNSRCRRKRLAAQVQIRKKRLEEQRAEYFRRLLENKERQFDHVEAQRQMKQQALKQQQTLLNMQIQKHQDARDDIQRTFLIRLKKYLSVKSNRYEQSLRRLSAARNKGYKARDIELWEKRLLMRLKHQQRIDDIMTELQAKRAKFIDDYQKKCQIRWQHIQDEIKKRSRIVRRAKRRYFRIKRKKARKSKQSLRRRSTVGEYRDNFEKLLDTELCEALNTAIQMTENPENIPFAPDDPIYKAATFIVHDIIAKYDKDLSQECEILRKVVKRIHQYFKEVSRFVLFRATQIITAARVAHRESKLNFESMYSIGTFGDPELSRLVSFNDMSSTIGMSSYSIHPMIDLKNVSDRQPTPPGSLASIIIDSRDDLKKQQEEMPLDRYDSIFLEHYIIRFKRELVVGMGRRVFSAIRCHYHGQIMDVRREFLDANEKVLAKMAAKAILGYAKNPLNFKSCVLLCISVFANKLIWSLQQELIKPERDPRGLVPPTQGCSCDPRKVGLCLFCENCM